MVRLPKLENKPETATLGIREQIPPKKLSTAIPTLLKKVSTWMSTRQISPGGSPFLRFHVIDMESQFDIEVGFPVAVGTKGDGVIIGGVLPAGEYATIVYMGKTKGYEGNKALIDWAASNGVQWDRWDDPKGDAFRCRFETFLTDPAVEPDSKKWLNEVAIKTLRPR